MYSDKSIKELRTMYNKAYTKNEICILKEVSDELIKRENELSEQRKILYDNMVKSVRYGFYCILISAITSISLLALFVILH